MSGASCLTGIRTENTVYENRYTQRAVCIIGSEELRGSWLVACIRDSPRSVAGGMHQGSSARVVLE